MNKQNALFVVNSPFQCLCMFEAIHYYSIKNYDVIFRPDSVELNNIMVRKILSEKNIIYVTCGMHPIYDILPFIFKKKKKYNYLFNGDYYFGGVYAYDYAMLCAKRRAHVIYLDDGVETLRAFSIPPLKRTINWKFWPIHKTCDLIGKIKNVERPTFFTIFNVFSDKYNVDRNKLSLFSKSRGKNEQCGAYIIGTNFDGIQIDKEDYFMLLDEVINHIRRNFPVEPIRYCPHRRNKDNKELITFLGEKNVSLFETQVSVEYDFMQRDINPSYVVGFASTALYTLKLLYPNTPIQNVIMKLKDNSITTSAFDILFSQQCNEIGVTELNFYK